jgi:hypothetical protein
VLHTHRQYRCKAVTSAGTPFAYRGYEKEGANLKKTNESRAEYEMRFTGMARDDGTFDGTIYWFKIKGSQTGLREWQPEHVRGTVGSKSMQFSSVTVGAGLAAADYNFKIEDGGLRLEEWFDGDKIGKPFKTRKCALLIEHTKVPSPSKFCLEHYFNNESFV